MFFNALKTRLLDFTQVYFEHIRLDLKSFIHWCFIGEIKLSNSKKQLQTRYLLER